MKKFYFPESPTAHKYLDGLQGVEIGGSAHNQFGLQTVNVDYTASMETIFKKAEVELCGEALKVDIEAPAHCIPLVDNATDFVISSHVIEHVFDPIAAFLEWKRIVKPGGIIYTICPRKDFVPGENRPITTLNELLQRHQGQLKPENVKMFENEQAITENEGLPKRYVHEILANHETGHFTVFDMNLMIQVCAFCGLEVIETQDFDDKVGNGFTVICRV